MKTPKQKEEDLVLKMLRIHNNVDWFHKELAKQCALIAVDEMQLIMDSLWKIQGTNEGQKSSYLEEVKKEIGKI